VDRTARALTTKIGQGTRIWAHCNIMKGVIIGSDCNICDGCFLEAGSIIGNRVTIKTNVSIWDGVQIADDVFVGPNVSFCNDTFPRSRQHKEAEQTFLRKGCSVGAGAVILPALEIGEYAMVGAGSVVTRSVPANVTVVGNPARITAKTMLKEN